MNIEEIFSAYTDKVADVHRFRWLTEGAADERLRALLEWKQKREAAGTTDGFVSTQAVRFPLALTGRKVLYGFHQLTVDDQVSALVRHTNRQHQWFLVEAYELFEEFLKHAYALSGFQDPTRWSSKDLGGLDSAQASGMSFDWFLARARTKTSLPRTALQPLRTAFPRLVEVESKNAFETDLYVSANLLAHMRHQIVHARGMIGDRRKFAEKVLDKLGFSGATMEAHIESVANGLLLDNQGAIYLMKVPDSDSPQPLHVRYDIFSGLTDLLLSYAREIAVALGYVPPSPS